MSFFRETLVPLDHHDHLGVIRPGLAGVPRLRRCECRGYANVMAMTAYETLARP